MGNNILGVFLWTAIYVKKDCHNKNSLTWISYLMLPSSLQNNYFSNIIIQEQLPLCKNDAAKMDFVPIRRVAYIKTAYKNMLTFEFNSSLTFYGFFTFLVSL